MPRRSHDLPLSAEINITSLVDVAFTLLVIFIITAPVLQGGVEVEVPEADVQPITAEDDPFFVTIARDGTVYVEETALTIEEFRDGFPQLMEAAQVDRVYIRGDSLANWARVLQVIGTVTQAGANFAMVGEPFPQRN